MKSQLYVRTEKLFRLVANSAGLFPGWNTFKKMFQCAFSIFAFSSSRGSWNTCCWHICRDWFFYRSRYIRNCWTWSCTFLVINLTNLVLPLSQSSMLYWAKIAIWGKERKRKEEKKKDIPNQTTVVSFRHLAAGQFTSLPGCWTSPDGCTFPSTVTPATAAGVQLQSWSLAPSSKSRGRFCVGLLPESVH